MCSTALTSVSQQTDAADVIASTKVREGCSFDFSFLVYSVASPFCNQEQVVKTNTAHCSSPKESRYSFTSLPLVGGFPWASRCTRFSSSQWPALLELRRICAVIFSLVLQNIFNDAQIEFTVNIRDSILTYVKQWSRRPLLAASHFTVRAHINLNRDFTLLEVEIDIVSNELVLKQVVETGNLADLRRRP
nr:hypothetical protein HmN_000512800 [Hymenolepis microstoma]